MLAIAAVVADDHGAGDGRGPSREEGAAGVGEEGEVGIGIVGHGRAGRRAGRRASGRREGRWRGHGEWKGAGMLVDEKEGEAMLVMVATMV